MIHRCVEANVSSYLLRHSESNSVVWVTSQPRLKMVNFAKALEQQVGQSFLLNYTRFYRYIYIILLLRLFMWEKDTSIR